MKCNGTHFENDEEVYRHPTCWRYFDFTFDWNRIHFNLWPTEPALEKCFSSALMNLKKNMKIPQLLIRDSNIYIVTIHWSIYEPKSIFTILSTHNTTTEDYQKQIAIKCQYLTNVFIGMTQTTYETQCKLRMVSQNVSS